MESGVPKEPRRRIAILRIVMTVIILFGVQRGELDPLVPKSFLQFVETHKLLEVINRLKSQLLNVNIRLVPCARNMNEPTHLGLKQRQPTIDTKFSPWNIEWQRWHEQFSDDS